MVLDRFGAGCDCTGAYLSSRNCNSISNSRRLAASCNSNKVSHLCVDTNCLIYLFSILRYQDI